MNTSSTYTWWSSLKHGRMLIAPSRLASSECFPNVVPPLQEYLREQLRRGFAITSMPESKLLLVLLITGQYCAIPLLLFLAEKIANKLLRRKLIPRLVMIHRPKIQICDADSKVAHPVMDADCMRNCHRAMSFMNYQKGCDTAMIAAPIMWNVARKIPLPWSGKTA
ncbi:MAG: hypothetical protein WCJ56_02340 [bacterium]